MHCSPRDFLYKQDTYNLGRLCEPQQTKKKSLLQISNPPPFLQNAAIVFNQLGLFTTIIYIYIHIYIHTYTVANES
ncbi:hypothetical protein L6452_31124 [Arctium lappa]|uniref:Uncharacterized protein n=1 Tax=Arctium lappa TaxID=4217 RepID=A0ACB8ZK21_ARCLA|nr:hypothetical protein L6452_31124 [Arctium lappa]